jgi:uncharacterized protein YciI
VEVPRVRSRRMGRYAVIREAGPGWDASKPLREQVAWPEHAAFMNALVDDGLIVLGGPVGGGPKTLLIVDAPDEDQIRRRLDADPWAPMGLLVVTNVEPWEILLGQKP